jgi:hypothetical protein
VWAPLSRRDSKSGTATLGAEVISGKCIWFTALLIPSGAQKSMMRMEYLIIEIKILPKQTYFGNDKDRKKI